MSDRVEPLVVKRVVTRPGTSLARRRLTVAALFLPAAAWMAVFYLAPMVIMVWTGWRENGFGIYASLFSSPVYLRVFWNTLEISALTTLATLLLGYPVAYLLTAVNGWLRTLILLLVSLPYWLDYVVRSYTWMILLGRRGLINEALLAMGLIRQPIPLLYNLFSVMVGMVQVTLPLMILTLFGAMLRIDRTLLKAASVHGATAWRGFVTVFLPLSLPAVYAASLLVFISSLSFYVIPALLGGPHETMISQSIVMLASQMLRWSDASALGALLLAFTFVLVVIYDSVFSFERLWGVGDDET